MYIVIENKSIKYSTHKTKTTKHSIQVKQKQLNTLLKGKKTKISKIHSNQNLVFVNCGFLGLRWL